MSQNLYVWSFVDHEVSNINYGMLEAENKWHANIPRSLCRTMATTVMLSNSNDQLIIIASISSATSAELFS